MPRVGTWIDSLGPKKDAWERRAQLEKTRGWQLAAGAGGSAEPRPPHAGPRGSGSPIGRRSKVSRRPGPSNRLGITEVSGRGRGGRACQRRPTAGVGCGAAGEANASRRGTIVIGMGDGGELWQLIS